MRPKLNDTLVAHSGIAYKARSVYLTAARTVDPRQSPVARDPSFGARAL